MADIPDSILLPTLSSFLGSRGANDSTKAAPLCLLFFFSSFTIQSLFGSKKVFCFLSVTYAAQLAVQLSICKLHLCLLLSSSTTSTSGRLREDTFLSSWQSPPAAANSGAEGLVRRRRYTTTLFLSFPFLLLKAQQMCIDIVTRDDTHCTTVCGSVC